MVAGKLIFVIVFSILLTFLCIALLICKKLAADKKKEHVNAGTTFVVVKRNFSSCWGYYNQLGYQKKEPTDQQLKALLEFYRSAECDKEDAKMIEVTCYHLKNKGMRVELYKVVNGEKVVVDLNKEEFTNIATMAKKSVKE